MIMNLSVSEIFYSVQGEGPLVGQPSVFLRLNGCNLRCSWCDSKHTWNDKDKLWDDFDVANELSSYSSNHIVITGGEPLLQKDVIYHLLGRFQNYHCTIETNGTIVPSCDLYDAVDLWMISPKKDQKFVFECGEQGTFMFKFVVDRKDKIDWIDEFIKEWGIDRTQYMLMPQAIFLWQLHDNLPWVIKLAKERGCRVSPRLHITAYGNKRGV